MKKRILTILLSLLFLVSFMAVPVQAGSKSESPIPVWVQGMRVWQMQHNKEDEEKNTPTYCSTEMDDINYMGDQDTYHLLDVYSPKGASPQQKLPVIVEVHGGAYVSCNKKINRQHGLYFASQGFRVVNINYTLVPEATIKQELQEITRVFQWIHENAATYGFDDNNIFLTGDSAGGHLVLLFTAAQTDPELQAYLEIKPSAGFRATTATCPVGSFTANDVRSKGMTTLLGPDFAKRNDRKLLSYESFDKAGMPPVFLVTTPSDTTAYPVTKAIHEDMTAKGIPHQYKEYVSPANDLEHVFNVIKPDLPESVQANQDICAFFRSNMAK